MGIIGIEAISSLFGMVIPPVWEFIKQKFLPKSKQSPEATINTLALTNPDMLDKVVSAYSGLYESLTKYFQRDISGIPSQWVVNLRAAIRPTFVGGGLIMNIAAEIWGFKIPTEFAVLYGVAAGEWFGSRII